MVKSCGQQRLPILFQVLLHPELGAVDGGRCWVGNGQGKWGFHSFRQRRVVHQSSCMLAALTHSNPVWSILSPTLSILPPA